jgi:Protein of unknown function (DUF3443)
MNRFSRASSILLTLALSVAASSCGGGGGGSGFSGSTPPALTNTVTITVDQGVAGTNGTSITNSINTAFVSVTFCLPGSNTCQTVDHIEVDSGSYGLRVLSSAMSLALPLQSASVGGNLVECTNFVDGYIWGPVVLSDVQIGSKTASSVPVQVIGDSRFPNVPTNCANTGSTEEDTVMDFGANGVLGIGPFIEDCGAQCAEQLVQAAYYGCTSTTAVSCQATLVPLVNQVQSVIAKFATDNNGVIITLPAETNPFAQSATGTMTFGVDTETNNSLSGKTALPLNGLGELSAQFNGQTYDQSFIDSGSNANFFTDTNLQVCTQSGITDFFCPAANPTNLSVILQGTNGVMSTQNFSVGNAFTFFSASPAADAVFPQLAGPYPGNTPTFDFGLPFFYGKSVAYVLEGVSTAQGTGPLIAF